MSAPRLGIIWWAWSALFAVAAGALEALVLAILASRGAVEFAGLGILFVLGATAIALLATGILILVWLLLAERVALLETHRAWIVLFAALISWPLWFSPISTFELVLAAPSLVGFLAPRFLVPRLSSSAVADSRSRRTAA